MQWQEQKPDNISFLKNRIHNARIFALVCGQHHLEPNKFTCSFFQNVQRWRHNETVLLLLLLSDLSINPPPPTFHFVWKNVETRRHNTHVNANVYVYYICKNLNDCELFRSRALPKQKQEWIDVSVFETSRVFFLSFRMQRISHCRRR